MCTSSYLCTLELIPFSKLRSTFLEPSSKNLVSWKIELGSRKVGNISNGNIGTQGNLKFFLHFLEILVGDYIRNEIQIPIYHFIKIHIKLEPEVEPLAVCRVNPVSTTWHFHCSVPGLRPTVDPPANCWYRTTEVKVFRITNCPGMWQ